MVRFYVMFIKKYGKTLEDVPLKWREEVRKALKEEGEYNE